MKSKLRLAEIALTAARGGLPGGLRRRRLEERHRRRDRQRRRQRHRPAAARAARPTPDAVTDSGPSDGSGAVDTNGDALPGPCVAPTGTSPSGTAPLQAAGPAVASTATRPQFDQTTADANYTIAKFLASGGSVASTYVTGGMTVTSANIPMTDNWDPVTNGIGDVSTFTPMFTVSADGTGTHTTIAAAITAARLVSNRAARASTSWSSPAPTARR